MAQTFDVLIVGGGIMGCCSAFELTQRGFTVAVLEKSAIGAGSTGKSSAIIRQHYSNELTARMARYSLRVFQEFRERVGDECGFRQTGFVALVPQEDRAGLEANVALQQRVGIRTSVLAPEELRSLIPDLATDDLAAAAYEPEAGYADPHLATAAYADAARRLGARILVDTEVTAIRFTGDRVAGVETNRGRFDAPLVLNCGGPWGARIAAMAGVDVPIRSCRVQVAVFRRPPEQAASHPVVLDFVHGAYFRAEAGTLTLVGSIDPAEADAVVDPDDYPEHVDSEFVAHMGDCFVRRYPPMERSESLGGFAGLYGVTPDWHPIVDELPRGSGCYICAGFSGHGFKLGPAVGLMVADLLTGADEPTFPADRFRFARYAEHHPVGGQYAYSIVG